MPLVKKKDIRKKKEAAVVKKEVPFNPALHYKQAQANEAKLRATQDDRFNRVGYDPRFRDDDEQTSTLNLQDDRFNKIFTDEFSNDYEMDEYGRRINKSSADYLNKFYGLSEKEIKDKIAKKKADVKEYGRDLKGEEDEEEEEEQEEEEDEDEEGASEGEAMESDEEGSELEESSDEGEDIEEAMKRYLAEADADEEATMTEDEEAVTSRIAVMNMDWSGLHSVDLLAILQHFAPPGGVVKRVTIYPSNYGKEAMAREAISGPQDIWKDTRNVETKKGYQGLDEHKLRRYERNVLKYYYAIAECDSVKTASHIYDVCDGMEFEDSVNTLDLRFVPPTEKFTNAPRDTATSVPKDYKAPSIFTKALGHSQQQLSWDRADPKRAALLTTDYSRNQLKDMSYETFVDVINDSDSDGEGAGSADEEGEEAALDEEDESGEAAENGEEDAEENGGGESEGSGQESKGKQKGTKSSAKQNGTESGKQNGKTKTNTKTNDKTAKSTEGRKTQKAEQMRNKYMNLLSGMYDKKPQKEELKISFDSNYDNNLTSISDDEDESMEREATFVPGLEDKAKEIMKQKELKELPAWDQYLHKRAEKQKLAREAKRDRAKLGAEETKQMIRQANSKKKNGQAQGDGKSSAELELLVAGDAEEEPGFNMRQMAIDEKNKLKKKQPKKAQEARAQPNFAMDLNDPRFGAIYTNKEYAIDRSNPGYKATATMKEIEKEVTNRRYDHTGAPKKDFIKAKPTEEPGWDTSRVANLKRKVENLSSSKQKQPRK